MGLSYAQREASALKMVAVGSTQTDAVGPSVNTLHSGLYKHLARLTFIHRLQRWRDVIGKSSSSIT